MGRYDEAAGYHCVALLSRHPLRQVDLGLTVDAARHVACVAGVSQKSSTPQNVLIVGCCGQASHTAAARALIFDLVHSINLLHIPWMMIGDFNLVDSDLCQLFACGVADTLDEPFCAQGPLLPTCRRDRRIDFAIRKHMHPTQFNQHEGVADHDCVVYGFDSSPHQCIKGCPKRSPIEVTDAEDIHHRWNHHWCATQFENFTKNKDVQAAWTMLSDQAERVLCSAPGKGCPWLQTWTPRPIHSRTFRQLRPAEPVHLRRLRRLHRRIAEILRHPDDAHLRSIAVIGARGMETYPLPCSCQFM